MHRKAPWRSKGEQCQPTHRPLRWNPSWLRDAHAHMGGSWDIPNTDSEPGKARWSAKGNPEEMPHISDSSYHKGATLSLSLLLCLSTHTLFPPNKHFTCFTAFHLCGNSFLKIQRAKTLPLATGLVARIQCSHCLSLTSISGQEPKSCFKPLQAKATRDQTKPPLLAGIPAQP